MKNKKNKMNKYKYIFNEKIKASRPHYKDGTLYFPDGTKSGEDPADCDDSRKHN